MEKPLNQDQQKRSLSNSMWFDRQGDGSLGEEDAMQFLWAVSYSDLLMVLLSFFVIYFSATDTGRPNFIEEISGALVKSGKDKIQIESKAGSEGKSSSGVTTLLQQIQQNMGSGLKVAADPNISGALKIDFEDNAFPAGSFEPTSELKADIEKLIKLFEPLSGRITLTFIGHTDDLPVTHKQLHSNMFLSNLRATYAAEYAVELGFDQKSIFTEGNAEHSRGTRSLSIRVKERDFNASKK